MSTAGSSRPSLRKACRNCTKSKRKCSIQLPRCLRCTRKNLACEYDLQPLSTPQSSQESQDPAAVHQPELCYLAVASSLNTQQTYSAINIRLEWGHVHYVVWLLQQNLSLVQKGKISALVHPRLQFRGSTNYFENLSSILETPESPSFHELRNVRIDAVPLSDALTAIQSLILYLISYLFSPNQSIQCAAESHLPLLHSWTSTLWTTAWSRVPANLTHWQAWLLGETTRRTIILSYILLCSFSGWKYGYCLHKLLFESLPFDGRVGLWRAESPQGWVKAAGVRGMRDVGTRLESFHEFGGKVKGGGSLDEDVFLMLVQVAHNGKKRADREFTICKR